MLFNSIAFLIFLPIVFFFYWFVFKKKSNQNLFIVLASLFFYGWWDWKCLSLILFTTFSSYLCGIFIQKNENDRSRQKLFSILNIVINLFILGIFKYYNFFVDNLVDLFQLFGIELGWVTLNLILPIGISFYTFQALSYTIDIYQKKIKACKDPVAFTAYIVFFPPLLAGPIERATNLLPQFFKKRTFDYKLAVDGCRQMLWGFFLKVVVADNCAIVANNTWDNFETASGLTLLIGAIAFSFQIYCDFAGYSDIAIGVAKLFGIKLMRNFNFPYFSRDIAEFWRRWHISLTTWFRDYIYFPLGGSRGTKIKTFGNTAIIFLVSGFWHGANWTFVCWGAYHAILFAPLLFLNLNRKHIGTVAEGKILPGFKDFGAMILTFFLALIGWIIFRSETISDALVYISRMFSPSHFISNELPRLHRLVFCIILLIIEWLQRNKQHGLQFDNINILKYRIIRWGIYLLTASVIIFFANEQVEFIYFQF